MNNSNLATSNVIHFGANTSSNLRAPNPNPYSSFSFSDSNLQKTGHSPNKNLNISQSSSKFNPNFMGENWQSQQTQLSEVKLARSCWLGYHRNNYHPSMTQYRISYDELNTMFDKIESVASSFKLIQFLYIIMVLLSTFSIILLVIGVFVEPGEAVTDGETFDSLDSASTGLIITGILLLILGNVVIAAVITYSLKRYELNIRKMLQSENQHVYFSRNIHWNTSNYCSFISIRCLPVTPEQYYMMMLQSNQLKIGKEYMEKIKKEQEEKH